MVFFVLLLGLIGFIWGALRLLLCVLPRFRRKRPGRFKRALRDITLGASLFLIGGFVAPERADPGLTRAESVEEPASEPRAKPIPIPEASVAFKLNVHVTPSDAQVGIYPSEGFWSFVALEAGQGPVASFVLEAGEYTYKVKADTYTTYEGSFSAPQNRNLAVSLQRERWYALGERVTTLASDPSWRGEGFGDGELVSYDHTVPNLGYVSLLTANAQPSAWLVTLRDGFEAEDFAPPEDFSKSLKKVASGGVVTYYEVLQGPLEGTFIAEHEGGQLEVMSFDLALKGMQAPLTAWLVNNGRVPNVRTIPDFDLQDTCKGVAKGRLLAPRTARFRDTGLEVDIDGSKRWYASLVAENAFGVPVRHSLSCDYDSAAHSVSLEGL